MKGLVADAYGGVRPNLVKTQVSRHVIGQNDSDGGVEADAAVEVDAPAEAEVVAKEESKDA